MIKIESSKARKDFADVVKGAQKGERYLIERHKKGIAAIVSADDLALLEEIERHSDLKAAHEGLAEYEREGAIPWDEAKAKLGL